MANSLLSTVQAAIQGAATPSRLVGLVPEPYRHRAAVVAHDAFGALDTYQRVRAPLFAVACLGVVGSLGMLYTRRRKGAEAWGVWLAAAGLSAGVAWLTRPGAGSGAGNGQAGAVPAGAPVAMKANAWLDARAARLDQTQPGWEDAALNRLLGG